MLAEAVRLLEYHSVARMRRGPGGGLVVARPDPTASIEAMSLYLDYQRIEIDHLRVVRERVEIGCVDYVSAMAGDPEVAHRLRLAGNDDGVGLLEGLPHRLHTEIAELSGNPVLALFLRIPTTLWHASGPLWRVNRRPGPPPVRDRAWNRWTRCTRAWSKHRSPAIPAWQGTAYVGTWRR